MHDDVVAAEELRYAQALWRDFLPEVAVHALRGLRHIDGIRHVHLVDAHAGRFRRPLLRPKERFELLHALAEEAVEPLLIDVEIQEVLVQREVRTRKAGRAHRLKACFRMCILHNVLRLDAQFHVLTPSFPFFRARRAAGIRH